MKKKVLKDWDQKEDDGETEEDTVGHDEHGGRGLRKVDPASGQKKTKKLMKIGGQNVLDTYAGKQLS
jgi:hypothetical protein